MIFAAGSEEARKLLGAARWEHVPDGDAHIHPSLHGELDVLCMPRSCMLQSPKKGEEDFELFCSPPREEREPAHAVDWTARCPHYNSSFLIRERGFMLQSRSCALISTQRPLEKSGIDELLEELQAASSHLHIHGLFVNGPRLAKEVGGHSEAFRCASEAFEPSSYRPNLFMWGLRYNQNFARQQCSSGSSRVGYYVAKSNKVGSGLPPCTQEDCVEGYWQ